MVVNAVPAGLLSHLGNALFHAAVHIAGHEAFHHVKHKISGHWLRNHDVSRALNESYIAALGMIEKQYKSGAPPAADKERVAAALKSLRKRAAEWFPVKETPSIISDEDAAKIFADPSVSTSLGEAIATEAMEAPPAFGRLLKDSFPSAFAYAFKELGLKGNEKVRAVMTQAALDDLRGAAADSGRKLDALSGDLAAAMEQHASMQTFQEEFRASIEAGLSRVSEQISNLEALVSRSLGEGDLLGYLMLCDGDGNTLERHAIRKPTISIGREKENDLQLAHGGVSGRHAELRVDDGNFEVRDLKSRNGTFVDKGTAGIRQARLSFGQKLRIGPFVLELLSPEAGEEPFEAPRTMDMP